MSFNLLFNSCTFNPAGELYAVGFKADTVVPDTSVGVVSRFSSDGTLLSQRQFAETGKAVFINDVHVMNNNNVLLAIRGGEAAQLLQVSPNLSTIIWSKSVGLPLNVTQLLVHAGSAYLICNDAVAKITIGGAVQWVTKFSEMTYTNATIDPTNGNVIINCSGMVGGSGMYIFSLSSASGAFVAGKQLLNTAYAGGVMTANCIVGVDDGYLLSYVAVAAGGATMQSQLVHLSSDWTTVSWSKDFDVTSTDNLYEHRYMRKVGTHLYIAGGYQNPGISISTITKLDLLGNLVWSKYMEEDSNTLYLGWGDFGRAAIDATTDKVGVCGWIASTAPIYVAAGMNEQGVVISVDNNSTSSFNTPQDTTHITPGGMTITTSTPSLTIVDIASEDITISIIPPTPAP